MSTVLIIIKLHLENKNVTSPNYYTTSFFKKNKNVSHLNYYKTTFQNENVVSCQIILKPHLKNKNVSCLNYYTTSFKDWKCQESKHKKIKISVSKLL
jgi:hypothetical protein